LQTCGNPEDIVHEVSGSNEGVEWVAFVWEDSSPDKEYKNCICQYQKAYEGDELEGEEEVSKEQNEQSIFVSLCKVEPLCHKSRKDRCKNGKDKDLYSTIVEEVKCRYDTEDERVIPLINFHGSDI